MHPYRPPKPIDDQPRPAEPVSDATKGGIVLLLLVTWQIAGNLLRWFWN